MTVKIGLFGGTFDPVHPAHFGIASQALRQFNLDKIIWIPAALSPFKKDEIPATAIEHRLAMVRLVCVHEPKFEVSAFEAEKGGISYSIDSLRYFQSCYPTAQFFWILGEDALAGVSEWKDADQLMRDLTFLAAEREGEYADFPKELKMKRIQFKLNPLSSTDFKSKSAQTESIAMLDSQVAAYIRQNRLYGIR